MRGTDRTGTLQKIVAANIRLLRERSTFSQERLGEASGYHRTYIGMVERGETNMSIPALEQVAKALGVEPADLLKPLA